MIDNKLFLFFISISLGLLLFTQIQPSITGNILLSEINVSISPFDNGRVGYFSYPEEITQYSRMIIDAEFINTGSTSYTKNTLLQIGAYDDNMTVLANRTGLTTSIMPGGRSLDTLRYTPLTYGFYWMHLIVSYGNKTADAWGSFYVSPYYSIIIPPEGDGGSGGSSDSEGTGGGAGSGGGAGGSGGSLGSSGGMGIPSVSDLSKSDTGRVLVTLLHDNKVYVRPGELSEVYVVVNNTGTMTLRQMMLLPRIVGNIMLDAQPMNVQTLKSGQSAIFMITLDVPRDIENRTYPLDFKVIFDKGNKSGHVDVVVGPLALDESLLNSILNYRYIINRLKSETDILYFDGKNTTLIEKYIDLADSNLIIAKDEYDVADYESVRKSLKNTREHLKDAVIELAKLRSEGTLIVFAPTIWLLIVLVLVMIVSFGVVYIHKRKIKNDSVGTEDESL